MTQEEKQILLQDICARLPYLETWVRYEDKDYVVTGYGHGRVSLLPSVVSSAVGPCPLVEEVRPYLRTMSSMTQEERREYCNECNKVLLMRYRAENHYPVTDWLLSHHFDFRGLIPMGLALEATADMYKTE